MSAREPFKSLLDAAGDKLADAKLDAAGDRLADAKIEMAPLKRMTRTVEKSMLRLDAARRGEVDDILDVVRGMVICGTMSELGDALAFFAEPDCGWKIVRVKNRFAAPTSGGWADCLLNIVRSDDPHQHVCECPQCASLGARELSKPPPQPQPPQQPQTAQQVSSERKMVTVVGSTPNAAPSLPARFD